MYTIYLKLYQALMTSIRPNVEPTVVLADALKKMEQIMGTFVFKTPKIKRLPSASSRHAGTPIATASVTGSAWKCTTSPRRTTSSSPE